MSSVLQREVDRSPPFSSLADLLGEMSDLRDLSREDLEIDAAGKADSNFMKYESRVVKHLAETREEAVPNTMLHEIPGKRNYLKDAIEALEELGIIYRRGKPVQGGGSYCGLNCEYTIEEWYDDLDITNYSRETY